MTIRHPDIGQLHYEFPDFPPESIPKTLPADAIPMHWHNDVCPSWCIAGPADHDLGVILWIDYPERSKREHFDERYALSSADLSEQTESWNKVLRWIENARKHCGPPREIRWLTYTPDEFVLTYGHEGETYGQVKMRIVKVTPPGYMYEFINADRHTIVLADDPKMPLRRRG